MTAEIIIALSCLFLIIYLSERIRRYRYVLQWRSELERNKWVRFYYKGKWRIGQIRSFKDNGISIQVRIKEDLEYFIIPRNISFPPKDKKL